jgi:hypothetical protein
MVLWGRFVEPTAYINLYNGAFVLPLAINLILKPTPVRAINTLISSGDVLKPTI